MPGFRRRLHIKVSVESSAYYRYTTLLPSCLLCVMCAVHVVQAACISQNTKLSASSASWHLPLRLRTASSDITPLIYQSIDRLRSILKGGKLRGLRAASRGRRCRPKTTVLRLQQISASQQRGSGSRCQEPQLQCQQIHAMDAAFRMPGIAPNTAPQQLGPDISRLPMALQQHFLMGPVQKHSPWQHQHQTSKQRSGVVDV